MESDQPKAAGKVGAADHASEPAKVQTSYEEQMRQEAIECGINNGFEPGAKKNEATERPGTISRVLGYLGFGRKPKVPVEDLLNSKGEPLVFYPNRRRKVKQLATGDVLIIGKRGSGKTALAVRLCVEDCADGIHTNLNGLEADRVNAALRACYKEEWPKTVSFFDKPDDLAKKCDVRLYDEIQIDYPARGFKTANKAGINAMAEERKDDGRMVSTVQILRNLDVLPAAFHDTVVRLRPMGRLPLIGFIWPWCVRPSWDCRWASEERQHRHRYGKGDQEEWWERLLGMGSYIRWDVIDPEIQAGKRTIDGSAQLEEEDPSVIARGRCLFDIDLANCYDSGQKVKEKHDAHVKKPNKTNVKKDDTEGAAPPSGDGGGAAPGQMTIDGSEPAKSAQQILPAKREKPLTAGQLENAISTLPDRKRRMMIYRYGLDGYGKMRTHEEVGKEFDVTRERSRQIEAKMIDDYKSHPWTKSDQPF